MFNPIWYAYYCTATGLSFVLNDLIWTPIVLFVSIVVYTPFLRLPFIPVRYFLELDDGYDPKWLFEQTRLFVITVLHFAIASAMIGLFVGILSGISLKIIRFVFGLVIREKVNSKTAPKRTAHQSANFKIGKGGNERSSLLDSVSIQEVTVDYGGKNQKVSHQGKSPVIPESTQTSSSDDVISGTVGTTGVDLPRGDLLKIRNREKAKTQFMLDIELGHSSHLDLKDSHIGLEETPATTIREK